MASPLKPLPRRLFELLEEQQEPFLLDVLENGCSKRIFRSKGTFRCWSMNNHGFRRRRASGIMRKIIKKALNWERSKLVGCFSEMRGEANVAGFHRLSSCSAAGEGESSAEIGWKDVEHSPVSVLELHSDESSSDHNHSIEDEVNSPTKSGSMQPRQLLLDYLKEMEEKSCDPCEFWGQKMSGNTMQEEITDLLGLDLSGTRREWTQFQAERREIGTEIGCIIFEEMREECVFDMLGFHYTLET